VEDPKVSTIDDLVVCEKTPVTLTTTGASSYLWTPASNLSNSSIANPVATPTSTTEYFVTGTTLNGCTAKDSVTITINPVPVYTLTADTTICKGTPLILHAQGGSSVLWTPNSTLTVINNEEAQVSPAALTTYYVTFSDNNNCTAYDSVIVDVRPDPIFAIGNGGVICEKDTIQLSASGGDVYVWTPGGHIDDSEVNNPSVFPTTTTEYFVNITDTVCNNEITLSTMVNVNPLPLITANKSNDLDCTFGFATLSATGAQDYQWSPATGLNDASIRTPRASPISTTEYTVTGTDANGCSNEAQVMIEVSMANKIEFFMPNAFTPNNDGLNDCYGIKYPGFTEKFEFSIYNRWGERIFYTKDPSTCWNGTYKGIKQDIGVYVYMIRMAGPCNGDRFEKGLFTLIR
jgi:gliding motility-associated-like protein